MTTEAYRPSSLEWPPSPEQWQVLNEIFDDIYRELRRVNTGDLSTHDLLSSTHEDTTEATEVDGDIIIRSGSKWIRLAKGTNLHVLQLVAGLPAWGTDGSLLTALNATQLTSGTVPDARFPATLPAVSGANLTNLDASDLASGTVPDARLSTNVPLINAANVFTADQRVNGAAGINIAPNALDGTLSLSDGIFERSRTTKQGEWIDVAFNAANFTGNGSMTWTVDSADQVTLKYMLIGKTMFVAFEINNTDVGGVVNTQLRIAIPGGFTPNGRTKVICQADDAAVGIAAVVIAPDGGTTLNFQRLDANAWTATTADNTTVAGSTAFEIN